MINWGRRKKGKFIFCQRRGIASKTRHDDIANKPTVATSTPIADSLPHIVASRTYIVACAVLDSSNAGSRRGLFHPTVHIAVFKDGPTGLDGQGEKVRFLSAPMSHVPIPTEIFSASRRTAAALSLDRAQTPALGGPAQATTQRRLLTAASSDVPTD